MNKAKISKIMLWPNRKVNLGNYETVDLNAGIEMVFDKPADIGSKEVKDAFIEARKVIKEELSIQVEPYRKLLAKKR